MKIIRNMWVILTKGANENTLISILSGRKGSSFIKEYIEQLWIERYLSFEEKLYYLNRRGKLPYRAQSAPCNTIPCENRLICGYTNAEIWAIYSYAFTEQRDFFIFHYRMPAGFDKDEHIVTPWNDLSINIKKLYEFQISTK